jgi:predicted MFS family arabinose efflux permease
MIRVALAGAACTCIGIGLARFAFVPLFPALVKAGWVDGAEAGLLGAAALVSYLAGALFAPAVGRWLGARPALAGAMAAVGLSFAASALPLGFWWLLAWRSVAGLAGAVLMALAGPAVQAAVPPERRGAASGVVIAGVGSGIAIGSVALPPLLLGGPSLAWLGLALLVAALAAFALPRLPSVEPPAPQPVHGTGPLVLAYAFSGAGMVPPMIYLSDLAARGLGLGVAAGSLTWLLFGLGAVAGTLLGGRAADRWGGARAAAIWFGVQAAALALCFVGTPGLLLAAPAGGFAGVGVTAVVLAWARETGGGTALWAKMTAAYAAAQAVISLAMAALFAATGESHTAVFAAGLLFSLAALGVGALSRAARARA